MSLDPAYVVVCALAALTRFLDSRHAKLNSFCSPGFLGTSFKIDVKYPARNLIPARLIIYDAVRGWSLRLFKPLRYDKVCEGFCGSGVSVCCPS
jgi:hypothetical protein